MQAIARRLTEERLHKLIGSGPYAISGAVLAVLDPCGGMHVAASGVDATGTPLAEDSLMGLASASKLATGLLILRLVDRGLLRLDGHIGDYLPEAAAAAKAGITIRRLLSHTSGMGLEVGHELSSPPGTMRWQDGQVWPGEPAAACLAAEPALEPGAAVQYSNVAYGLLALAAERVAEMSFARLLKAEVFEPLRIEAYIGELPPRRAIVVADVPSPFIDTPAEPYNGDNWMASGLPWACVISDVRGLLALTAAYARSGNLLSPEISHSARTDQTEGVAGGFGTTEPFLGHDPSRKVTWEPCPWGLSIELQGGKLPHWAPANLPSSFGQIGSSGCLGWHDPASGVTWAILGARSTDGGWLLRHGGRIAQTALQVGALAATRDNVS